MKRIVGIAALLLLTVAVAAQSVNQSSKISPWLAAQVRQATVDGVRRAPVMSRPVDVLLKLTVDADETEVLSRYEAALLSRIGRVLIVRLPLRQVTALAADARVERVEAERMPRPMLDRVAGQIGADKVWSGTQNQLPQAYTGKGVVVGIVDAGFDYIHPFFRDSNGETRIVWAKDYLNGQLYDGKTAVTAAMHSSDAAEMYHGTHVAGIAAGSRVEDADWDTPTAYQGIASEADIAEGAVDASITEGGLSSATTVQAFSDIFAYAEAHGQPCVINYSMGDTQSFYDGRQLDEEAIRSLLQKPGRALVVASGNSGGTARLAHKTAAMSAGGAGVCFNDWESYGTYFGIELKVKNGQTVTLRYTDTGYTTNKATVTKTVAELAAASSLVMGSKLLKVQHRGQADGYEVIYVGCNSAFTTSDRVLVTISGDGEAWLYADALCAQLENVSSVENHQLAEQGYSVCWPAVMDEVVSVGNIAHRFQILTLANKYASQGGQATPTDLTEMESTKGEGYLARSSSVGPTLAGGMKPDVCAPGVNIVSAENFFISDDAYYSVAAWDIAALDTESEVWGTAVGYFHVMAQTGTSMSAPAVAGTIALWMQADPTLTTERIKDVIAHSSRQPDSGLTYPNNQYGYGEIDAYKGLLYLLNLTAIEELSDHQPQRASFRLDGRRLTVSFADGSQSAATVRIFSVDGRQLLQTTDTTVDLSALPTGVYAVQLTTGQRATTGSTLIRL